MWEEATTEKEMGFDSRQTIRVIAEWKPRPTGVFTYCVLEFAIMVSVKSNCSLLAWLYDENSESLILFQASLLSTRVAYCEYFTSSLNQANYTRSLFRNETTRLLTCTIHNL